MERPQVEVKTTQRNVTGEIVYLDEMRRLNVAPKSFLDLADMAIQMYETQADMYPEGQRPDIMEDYEQFDDKPSEVVASCTALADELLKLKEPGSQFTFVDIAVEAKAETVLNGLKAISVGSVLADDEDQLAIPSDGEYYPVLDFRKQDAKLVGVGLRVWGWDDQKYIFTNSKDEKYDYPRHLLVYPSDEKSSSRQLELSFGYVSGSSTRFTESVSLNLSSRGSVSISSKVWAMEYAETGYEGHGGTSRQKLTDEEIGAFGDLIAKIVGDEPKSSSMVLRERLDEITQTAATPHAQQAIQNLIEATWPAQAEYFLTRTRPGADMTIREQLRDETTAGAAITAINSIIAEWKA